jgi:F-type H+-transporting ATPase subunit b
MLAFSISTILFLAETGNSAGGGFMRFYDEWLNIPGFEAWKFINLAIFIALAIYFGKKPLSDAFKTKREIIRAELIKAEQEKQAALTKLTAIEARLAQLETEKAAILKRAKAEAASETKRVAESTAAEIERLRQQTEAEIARLYGQYRAELRRFSAEESIRRATEKIRSQMDGEKDARLVRASIQEIGGLN